MTVHILDMSTPRFEALCRTPTPFMVSPGIHDDPRTGVDCVVCLDLDEHARSTARAVHPSNRSNP